MNEQWEKEKHFGLGFVVGIIFTLLFELFLYIYFII
jgi:hypothetical protein